MYDVLQRRQAALGHSIAVKRKDWEHAKAAISSLTFDQLAAAAKSIRETHTHNDPTIKLLERLIQTVASQVPQSFARMRTNRSYMQALLVCLGMAAFWLTINPADLRSVLVLKLAGVEVSCDDLSSEAQKIRQVTARMNPVAVAQFFHQICTGVFNVLLAAGTNQPGIFGQVSNYFGVVETNGRGMLHLHSLVWLAGNLEFRNLRSRLQSDAVFAAKMIHYLKSVIKCSVDLAVENLENLRSRLQPPSAREPETDSAFVHRLNSDSNAVASKRQMHSKNHTRTCFKYAKKGPQECRFLFPRKLIAESHVDSHGVIQLERNNEWVTPWNPCLSSMLRSNHEISFIPTVTKALSAMYYMTNYATKYDVSQYQMITTVTLVKRSQEEAEKATDPSERDLRLRRQGMEKFALRAFNRLSGDREISGPQAASCLLDLPDYYTLPTTFRNLNLRHLRNRFKGIIQAESGVFGGEEESAIVTRARRAPRTMFDHYYWRGPWFSRFSLYEYFKLVTIKPRTKATSRDIWFLPEHPDYGKKVQSYSGKQPANRYTVALLGPLSENQSLENKVRGGHPETECMRNELALILLGLLVPWNLLPTLFTMFNCADQTYEDHCAEIWNIIRSSLPHHLQDVAQNIELLRKSKADAQVDAALRQEARDSAFSQTTHEEWLDDYEDLDNDDGNNGDDDNDDESPESTRDFIDLDTLHLAFSIIRDKWADSDSQDAADIPSLVGANQACRAPETNSASDEASILPRNHSIPGTTSDFHRVSPGILQQWQDRLKAIGSDETPEDSDVDSEENSGDGEVDLTLETDGLNSLIPIMDRTQLSMDLTVSQLACRVGANPTGLSITQLVQEILPLNQKQFLAVKKVLNHAIRLSGKTTVEAEDQMLLYIGGEGGVGKSRVIQAIEFGYGLLQRKNEVLLMAPTGDSAYNIGGRTIHSALSINFRNPTQDNINSHTYSLLRDKTIMIIDEISMVSLTMLHTINQQCNKIRALQQDSTAILGGFPIVVFFGDFHQFPPIKAQPLWQTPDAKVPGAMIGQLVWHQFTNVILLDEQMRQQRDLKFQGLLRRARAGTMTAADLTTLNKHVIQSLPSVDGLDTTCVTRSNKRRHHINRLQLRRFAEARGQDIYVFPAIHYRTKVKRGGLLIDKLLETPDGDHAKGPGLFLYTKGMPITILYNSCTPLGLVNGARGMAAGIVPDPNGKLPIQLKYQLE